MKKVLILGGYGNFGKRIAAALAKSQIPIIIAGRDVKKAEELQKKLHNNFVNCQIETVICDANSELETQLVKLKPAIVINTIGPFQNSNYSIAQSCIKYKINYIDLSDGRDFVVKITDLNEEAKQNGVTVISGASTVPSLSSAVLEKYKAQFLEIDSLIFGISPGQKAERGLATTKAILSYIGKSLKPCGANNKSRFGWQNLYRIKYPEIGKRWMANCDIPDLDLLPQHYNIKSIQFSAGMESSLLHLGIWLFSWLVRLKLVKNIENHAKILLKISHYFDFFGSANGGMHIIISGKDINKKPKTIKWFIIAKNGDGPQIPTIPAIILTKKIIANKLVKTGAFPCVAMVSLDEYLDELKDFDVKQYVF